MVSFFHVHTWYCTYTGIKLQEKEGGTLSTKDNYKHILTKVCNFQELVKAIRSKT